MGSMSDEGKNDVTSSFLWKASKLVKEISYTMNIQARRNLDNISSELRGGGFTFLDGKKEKQYICPKCKNPWREGKFSLRVRRIKPCKRIQNWSANTTISSFKQKLQNYCLFKNDNILILRCLHCNNITKCYMSKEIPINNSTTFENQNIEIKSDSVKKRKKRKKKDVTAGLKIENILTNRKKVLSALNFKDVSEENSSAAANPLKENRVVISREAFEINDINLHNDIGEDKFKPDELVNREIQDKLIIKKMEINGNKQQPKVNLFMSKKNKKCDKRNKNMQQEINFKTNKKFKKKSTSEIKNFLHSLQ